MGKGWCLGVGVLDPILGFDIYEVRVDVLHLHRIPLATHQSAPALCPFCFSQCTVKALQKKGVHTWPF